MASYGGDWTLQKLDTLKGYLDSYTTALKKQRFKLLYIDAFAGDGTVELKDSSPDSDRFIEGSASIAVQIDNKPFDKFIFIDKSLNRCKNLRKLKKDYPKLNIEVRSVDANKYLQKLCKNWQEEYPDYRGVLFLDPFATQVEWKTVTAAADTQSLDVWILFPISAVARMLPTQRKPDDIDEKWVSALNRVFGDESWRDIYANTQLSLLEDIPIQETRNPGVGSIREVYKRNLSKIMEKERLLKDSKTLVSPTNSPLFELIFFVGNPAGTKIAHGIAKHLLGRI